jgi:glycosyltransferase involved in cell wall biosynthesis
VSESDVVVVNLPQFEGFIPAIWAKLGGKKVIVIYHCEVITDNWPVKIILCLANWVSLTLAKKIIVYTQDYAASCPELKPFLSKTEEIYPPIPEIIPGKIKVGGNFDYLVGMAARLAREKGVEYLLEAMPEIEKSLGNKRIKIVVAGPTDPVGEEVYKKKVLELIANSDGKVELLGTLNEKEMAAFYKQIDVLVLPSVNGTESFGMVQVEAMKQGTPVVATDLPGVRVPIQQTGMGKLVPAKNPHQLAIAIAEVLKYSDKSRKGHGDPKIIFNINKTYEKYRSVLFS